MMDEEEENFLPETQPVDDRVLKDVVAYVEVRCGFENRSKGVSNQLEILGAKVLTRLTKEVTHVIWKDGKPSSHERARKWGIHVLSVLWVDSCRQNQEHVSESLFQVKTGDDGSPIIGKLKRLKSMQPKQIEDQVKKSAEKFAKRQKKKANEAGSLQRPYVFVAETQSPYSPLRFEARPLTPTLADTPNSMRLALEALDRAKKQGMPETLDSPVHGERSIPLHKRLFSVTASSDDVSDYGKSSPDTSKLRQRSNEKEAGNKSIKRKSEVNSKRRKTLMVSGGLNQVTPTRRSSRRSSVMRKTDTHFLDENSLVKMGCCSESSRNSSPVFSKNSADNVFVFDSEKMTSENNSLQSVQKSRVENNKIQNSKIKRSSKSIDKRKTDSESGMECTQESGEQIIETTVHKRKRSAGKTKLNQRKKALCNTFDDNHDDTSSSSSNENSKKRKKRRLLTLNDFGIPPVQLVEPSRTSASDSADSSRDHQQRNKDTSTKKRRLLTVNDFGIPPEQLVEPSRSSASDSAESSRDHQQRNKDTSTKKRKTLKDETKAKSMIVPVQGLRSSLEEFNFKRRNKRQRSKKSSSSDSSTSSEEKDAGSKEVGEKAKIRKSSKEKAKRTLCMTSLNKSDQGIVISIIHKLGKFNLVNAVCDSTTHVILGQDRRTLNVLAAIARGCWLLSIEWVFKSLEEGAWLPEEPFEQHDLYPTAQLSRLEYCASEGTYKTDLFSSFSPVFIGDDTNAPTDRIQELIEWCGGRVCSSARVARLAVGKTQPRTNLKTVDEKWVFDCINELRTCPLKEYSIDVI